MTLPGVMWKEASGEIAVSLHEESEYRTIEIYPMMTFIKQNFSEFFCDF